MANLEEVERAFSRLDSTANEASKYLDYERLAADATALAANVGELYRGQMNGAARASPPAVPPEYLALLSNALTSLATYARAQLPPRPPYAGANDPLDLWRRARLAYFSAAIQLGRGPGAKSPAARALGVAFYFLVGLATYVGVQVAGFWGALTAIVTLLLMRMSLRSAAYSELNSAKWFAAALKRGAKAQAFVIAVSASLAGWRWGSLGAVAGFVIGLVVNRQVVRMTRGESSLD